jgi:hypothetical protein
MVEDDYGWTDEEPTKPGLYWYWQNKISHPYIVEIDNQFKVVTTYSVTGLESYDGYWLGPLETSGKLSNNPWPK